MTSIGKMTILYEPDGDARIIVQDYAGQEEHEVFEDTIPEEAIDEIENIVGIEKAFSAGPGIYEITIESVVFEEEVIPRLEMTIEKQDSYISWSNALLSLIQQSEWSVGQMYETFRWAIGKEQLPDWEIIEMFRS